MDVVAWFSCGAASAVAAKLASEKYPQLRIVNNPVKEEDEDNLRFLKDVEVWIGIKVETSINFKYPDASAKSVWIKRQYMSGVKGAPCTNELKKEARRQWEDLNSWNGYHVFGYDADEKDRHQIRNEEMGGKVLPILIEAGLTKQHCFEILTDAGIKLPRVYSMASRFGSGFPNANCIGCVKATSPTYWNHVRETFPDKFQELAELSREIGCKLTRVKGKRIYLDELHPDARGQSMKTMKVECGISCKGS